jgi:SAM-dependent methyltransferase
VRHWVMYAKASYLILRAGRVSSQPPSRLARHPSWPSMQPKRLEKAKARCAAAGLRNVEFRRGDAEHLPFEEAHFDGVVTRLAVHHFADPQRAFDEMFRILRPQGTAVIVDVVFIGGPG